MEVPEAEQAPRPPCRYVRLPLAVPEGLPLELLVREDALIDEDGRVLGPDGQVLGPEVDFPFAADEGEDDFSGWAPFARTCRLVVISDTHNMHKELRLPAGDVLLHCGDFTNGGTGPEFSSFDRWLGEAARPLFGKKIFCVAGNHDEIRPPVGIPRAELLKNCELLESQFAKKRLCPPGLRLYGQSWPSKKGRGAPPRGGIPEPRADILISHGPPVGILDSNREGESCGSNTVLRLLQNSAPRLHLFGHIHESYGARLEVFRRDGSPTLLLNASNASPPPGLPPIMPDFIAYPVTVVDLELEGAED